MNCLLFPATSSRLGRSAQSQHAKKYRSLLTGKDSDCRHKSLRLEKAVDRRIMQKIRWRIMHNALVGESSERE